MQAEITPELERLLTQSQERRRRRLVSREMLADGAFAAGFLVVAAAMANAGDNGFGADWPVVVGYVVGMAVLAGIYFDTGAGHFTLAELLFVPMLLLFDPAVVPLLVGGAHLLRAAVLLALRKAHRDRLVIALADSWFAVPPALVLVIAGNTGPEWSDWPIYLVALLAQFAGDGIVSAGRAYACLGIRPRQLLGEMREVYMIDTLLAPVGLLAAFAAADAPAAALLVLPLAVLFHVFAGEREHRIEQQLELSRAYRGTALLLGDVIEDDDEYTGQHTRGVVILAGMVADELGVDEQTRRETEFGALLHDVGKIAIPKEIINKPGPLDADEWKIMKTHTIEGQRLLERVGGILGRVGVVVRASHERWDGKGYPDGLAGEDIPVAARIVSCCDAYNAMTTDRSYRAAMPVHVALAELRANAGTQFDPEVVETVCALIERWDPEMVAEPATEDVDAAIRALLAGSDEE